MNDDANDADEATQSHPGLTADDLRSSFAVKTSGRVLVHAEGQAYIVHSIDEIDPPCCRVVYDGRALEIYHIAPSRAVFVLLL